MPIMLAHQYPDNFNEQEVKLYITDLEEYCRELQDFNRKLQKKVIGCERVLKGLLETMED